MKSRLLSILVLLSTIMCFASCGQVAASDEPIVLTIGTYGSVDNYPIVRQFNDSQDKYIVQSVDYSQGGLVSYEDAVIKLNTDLAGGNGPDIIYFWKLRIDPELYGRKGYLENLYPYLDSDPELNRDDFVQSLFEVYEVNGALYQTLPGFGVMTILAPKSVADSISEWTFNDLMTFAETNGGASVFSDTFTKSSFLSAIMQVAVDEFADFENYTASFDSSYFKSVLEFCNSLETTDIQNDDAPLLRFYCLSSFMELQYFEYLFGEDVGIIGFPSVNGSISYFCNVTDQYGINAASEHKQEAWQFIRIFFTKEYQDNNINMLIPSNLNSMQELIEISKSTIMTEDAEGNKIEMTNRGNFNFEYHAATEEQVEQMLELIDSASAPARSNSTITSIVMEEAEAYFEGDKTLDETAALIQGRVSLYLSEQK